VVVLVLFFSSFFQNSLGPSVQFHVTLIKKYFRKKSGF
jgi:hypothetical protein